MDEHSIHGFACSIFRMEIEHLIEHGRLTAAFTYVDSDLHMFPEQLEAVLGTLIEPGCFLCYGTCHARMKEQQDHGVITRVAGLNCCEIFLGRTEYRRLRTEGAFFLLPEWTLKWEHIFKDLLGFSKQEVAAQFMNEMHTKFIYLDTGVSPVPEETLAALSHYFSLPVEIHDIDLTLLCNTILDGLKKLRQ